MIVDGAGIGAAPQGLPHPNPRVAMVGVVDAASAAAADMRLPNPRPRVVISARARVIRRSAVRAVTKVAAAASVVAADICLPNPRPKAVASMAEVADTRLTNPEKPDPEAPHIPQSPDRAGPRPEAVVELGEGSILAPMALWSGEYDGDMELCRVAAISIAADTGAAGSHFLGEDVMGVVYDRVPLVTARWVVTGNGKVKVTEWGKVKVNGRVYEGLLLPGSQLSLMSIDEMCSQGWRYEQSKDGARLWNEEDGDVISLVRKGSLWVDEETPGVSMGPISGESNHNESEVIMRQEMHAYMAALEGMWGQEEMYMGCILGDAGGTEHRRRGHTPHNPKCRFCMQGRMQHRAKRRRPQKTVEGPAAGLKLSSDLMGPFPAELRAYIYSIMVVDDEFQWAEVGGLKSK